MKLRLLSHEAKEGWTEFFENFSYKPNWHFDYQLKLDFDEHKVMITMRVPDSRAPTPDPVHFPMGARQTIPLIPISKEVNLPEEWYGEDHAKEYIRFHIRDMEDHEMDEWFRYKGELPFDPHKRKDG